MTLPWGKHKGQPLSEIPTDYLKWLDMKFEADFEIWQSVRAEIQRRYRTGTVKDPPPVAPAPPRGIDEDDDVPF